MYFFCVKKNYRDIFTHNEEFITPLYSIFTKLRR